MFFFFSPFLSFSNQSGEIEGDGGIRAATVGKMDGGPGLGSTMNTRARKRITYNVDRGPLDLPRKEINIRG